MNQARGSTFWIFIPAVFLAFLGSVISWRLSFLILFAVVLAKVLYDYLAPMLPVNRKAEATLLNMNRLYSFTSALSQMIVRARDEETLFREVCRIAVDVGKFRMAWVGVHHADRSEIVPLAFMGYEMGYLSQIGLVYKPGDPNGNGPLWAAIKEGRHIVCNDVSRDPKMSAGKDLAAERGYCSSISLPIYKPGEIAGVITLYANVTQFFDEAEVALLLEAAGDISFALDVFERGKQRNAAEEAVLRGEKRYQALTEISPVGIFHAGPDGLITYVNPKWCEIAGVPFDRAPGYRWADAVHPDDREGVQVSWEGSLLHNSEVISEFRFLRPDGTIAWVILQLAPGYDAAGRIPGFVGTITDITDRKRAELQIQESEEKYRNAILLEKQLSDSLINSLPGIFYLYTREGHFLRWNNNFEQVTGYSAREIEEMRPLDFFDAGEKEMMAEKIEEVFVQGQSMSEAHFLLKDGQKIPYYFTGLAIEYGGRSCLAGVGIDISQRVSAQEKMKQTSEQLRQLAAHLQDIREEERASMAREIHDELGQQLTGLKMDIYWLKDELSPMHDKIELQMNQILKLADQIINTVRRIASTLRPSILDDLGLEEALKSYSREFQVRFGPIVSCKIDLAQILLSPKASIGLFRIVQESLTNIARHAEASNVYVSLLVVGENIELLIKDNGKGFDTHAISGKRTLGLLGMQERVYMLDGKYLVHSIPGAGTEIGVSIPLGKILKKP